MRVCHVALGGCLTWPDVSYGITEDTGGHIAYVLGAAKAQAQRDDVEQVAIVTRAFRDAQLGPAYWQERQEINAKFHIQRLRTDIIDYLSKERLEREIPAIADAFLRYLAAETHLPTLIHAHFADAAVLARAARRKFGIPFLYTPHSLALSKSQGGASAVRIENELRALQEADGVIVSSRDEAETQVGRYGCGFQSRVYQVPPGIDFPKVEAIGARPAFFAPFDDPQKPLILAIARPVARKNLAALAQLYAETPRLHEAANLMILAGQHHHAADGNAEVRDQLDTILKVAEAPNMRGRMAVPPQHEASDIPALYRFAAQTRGVFVNIAKHEPFGLTLLEAAHYGLPVVGTSEGGAADIVRQIGHGVSVPPDQPDAIVAGITGLLTNADQWHAASLAGTRGVKTYDWTQWAARVNDVARDACGSAPLAAPRRMLFSDIDNTLTGSRDAALRFRAWYQRSETTLAVATGRSLTEARRVLHKWQLPMPEVFITSVGTEIYLRDSKGRWQRDQDYADWLDIDWNAGVITLQLRRLGIPLQPPVEQRRWKVSGFGTARDAARISAALIKRSLPATVIASHGRLIDVVPFNAGKARAIEAVCRRYSLTAESVAIAGDSGNDRDMLLAAAQGLGQGILVGNALTELTKSLPTANLCLATAHHADGVLEGMSAIGWDAPTAAVQMAAE